MSSERRRWPRSLISSDAQLLLNDALWCGSAFDISVGGLSLVFDDGFSVSENQQIELGLAAAGGILHLSGRVRSLRPHTCDEGLAQQSRLSIEFSELGSVKQQVLASFLDGIRESSVSVNVIGLLVAKDTKDLVAALGTQGLTTPVLDQQIGSREHRLVPRTSMKMRVALGDVEHHVHQQVIETKVLDVSATGIAMQYPSGLVVPGNHVSLRLFPEEHGFHSESAKRVCQDGYALRGRVAWVAASGDRIGIQFLSGNGKAKQHIAQLVQHALTSELHDGQSAAPEIASTHLEFHNELGQRISAYHDRFEEGLPNAPVAVIAPGYGETKREYIALSYHLACNGFEVLRYDHTDHVGESEGDHIHSTLGRMQRDLVCTLDYVKAQWPQRPLVVIAANLAGRVLMKVAAHDRRISLLVLLGGVMDVRQTLLTVHQDDLLKKYLSGVRHGVINMLGLNVQVDRWLENAASEGYADLATTLRDVALARAPMVLFAAEQDAWVNLDLVMGVSREMGSQRAHLIVTPETLQRLAEHPRKAGATFREIVGVCVTRLKGTVPDAGLSEPSEGQIRHQDRFEMARGRTQHHRELKPNVEFWTDYLSRFQFVVNIHDYWQLLDHVHRLLGLDEVGGNHVGVRVLDAGCGNGHFGMFLKVNQEYRALKGDHKVSLIRYTGLDFVTAGLAEAKRSLEEEQQAAAGRLLDASFVRGDLNAPLPFANEQFDRVVCNLVVGHLENPSFTISEFLRVLSPGGKLILTNLKPDSDMSQIYRNFQRQTENPDDVEEARDLLNNSADIRQAATEGVFRFWDRQEFAMLLLSAGAEDVRIFKTFAEQAYIAVSHKSGNESFTAKVTLSDDTSIPESAGVRAHI
jgi:ubiquinone/menaquinone biosynthesis C-methylase UbiE